MFGMLPVSTPGHASSSLEPPLNELSFAPDSVWSPFTALPIQIFNWASRPQSALKANAAAGILVLLALLLTMNAAAIVLRDRFQRQGRS